LNKIKLFEKILIKETEKKDNLIKKKANPIEITKSKIKIKNTELSIQALKRLL
jgi:hypothetical protein